MKRLLAILVALLVLVALVGVAGFAVVSSDRARARVEAELAEWLDVSVRVGQAPRATLVTGPALVLADVRLTSRDGIWEATAGRVEAGVDLAGLIFGEIRISSLTVSGASIEVARGSLREAEPGRIGREFARLLQRPVSLTQGKVRFGEAGGAQWRDIVLRTAPSGDGASLRGSLAVADQTVEFAINMTDRGVLSGEAGGRVNISVAAPLATLRVEGEVRAADAGRIEGQLEFATSDIRGLSARFGTRLAGEAAFGTARLSGSGTVSLAAVNLDRARLELDGNVGEGRIGLASAEGRTRLDGTLAFESFDVSVYAREFGELLGLSAGHPAADADWRRWRFAETLRRLDIDLRLSAARLVLGPLSGGPGAVSLRLREGDLSVDLSETAMAGGNLELSGRLKPGGEDGSFDFSMKAMADGLAAEALPLADERLPAIRAGRISGRIDRSGKGGSIEEVLASIAGTASVEILEARFDGEAPDAVLGRLLADGNGMSPGSGSFRRIAVEAELGQSELRIGTLLADTAMHRLEAAGRISLPGLGLSLRGQLGRKPEPANEPGPSAVAGDTSPLADAVPVLLRGTPTDLRLLPDLTRIREPGGR